MGNTRHILLEGGIECEVSNRWSSLQCVHRTLQPTKCAGRQDTKWQIWHHFPHRGKQRVCCQTVRETVRPFSGPGSSAPRARARARRLVALVSNLLPRDESPLGVETVK